MGQKFVFENIYGEGINLCVHESSQLEISISTILGSYNPWNLFFHCNLTNLEINDLERQTTSLSHVPLSPSVPNVKAWVPSSSRVLSIKSFFLALINLFIY